MCLEFTGSAGDWTSPGKESKGKEENDALVDRVKLHDRCSRSSS